MKFALFHGYRGHMMIWIRNLDNEFSDDSSPQVRRQKSGIRRQTSRTGYQNMVKNPGGTKVKPKDPVSAEETPSVIVSFY